MNSTRDGFKVVPSVYIIFPDGDKVLLIRRAHTGYHDGECSLPAGHVDSGEPTIWAAIREAKEEVGVDINSQNLRLAHTMYRHSSDPDPHERVDLFFKARKWRGELKNGEPHKCDEIR